jgi:hypothetical protein
VCVLCEVELQKQRSSFESCFDRTIFEWPTVGQATLRFFEYDKERAESLVGFHELLHQVGNLSVIYKHGL